MEDKNAENLALDTAIERRVKHAFSLNDPKHYSIVKALLTDNALLASLTKIPTKATALTVLNAKFLSNLPTHDRAAFAKTKLPSIAEGLYDFYKELYGLHAPSPTEWKKVLSPVFQSKTLEECHALVQQKVSLFSAAIANNNPAPTPQVPLSPTPNNATPKSNGPVVVSPQPDIRDQPVETTVTSGIAQTNQPPISTDISDNNNKKPSSPLIIIEQEGDVASTKPKNTVPAPWLPVSPTNQPAVTPTEGQALFAKLSQTQEFVTATQSLVKANIISASTEGKRALKQQTLDCLYSNVPPISSKITTTPELVDTLRNQICLDWNMRSLTDPARFTKFSGIGVEITIDPAGRGIHPTRPFKAQAGLEPSPAEKAFAQGVITTTTLFTHILITPVMKAVFEKSGIWKNIAPSQLSSASDNNNGDLWLDLRPIKNEALAAVLMRGDETPFIAYTSDHKQVEIGRKPLSVEYEAVYQFAQRQKIEKSHTVTEEKRRENLPPPHLSLQSVNV